MSKRGSNNLYDLTLERRRRSFRELYVPRRHTALLVAIVSFFAVYPLAGTGQVAKIVFGIATVLLLVVALYAIQVEELLGDRAKLVAERRRRLVIGLGLAGTAAVERIVTIVWPTHELFLIASICYLVLFGFVTWQELRAVVRQSVVTRETISMSVSVYLLMGITWGFLYAVIQVRHPQAFSFGGSEVPSTQDAFPILIYFSLTTLSTVGFGDITPVLMQARYAAVAEAITGQFYLAILVARLVGIYMSNPRDTGKA
jgi:ion channel